MFLRKGVWAARTVVEVLGGAGCWKSRVRTKDSSSARCQGPGVGAAVPALPSRRPRGSVPAVLLVLRSHLWPVASLLVSTPIDSSSITQMPLGRAEVDQEGALRRSGQSWQLVHGLRSQGTLVLRRGEDIGSLKYDLWG